MTKKIKKEDNRGNSSEGYTMAEFLAEAERQGLKLRPLGPQDAWWSGVYPKEEGSDDVSNLQVTFQPQRVKPQLKKEENENK